jgi:excisionase family DNA binding protein
MWIESPLIRAALECNAHNLVGDQMATKEFMNVRETAQQLGVHENTVRNWEARGVLRGIKLPGSGFRRFPREDVERMRREMLESYAPATELPGETRTGVSGAVIDDDLL